ncbi:hypothetical protein [Mycoplasma elephantis]|uniref:hypothetical protein n=1 Tax=Mycoplasma elephantis TaxID=114882 RepID=UPI000482F374|nr:hypothetical protein [Mycoplasma elephantis]
MNNKCFSTSNIILYRSLLIVFYISFVFIIPLFVYILKKKQIKYEVNLIKWSLENISLVMNKINQELSIYNYREYFTTNKWKNTKNENLVNELNILISIYNLHVKLLRKEFFYLISKILMLHLKITNYDLLDIIIEK